MRANIKKDEIKNNKILREEKKNKMRSVPIRRE